MRDLSSSEMLYVSGGNCTGPAVGPYGEHLFAPKRNPNDSQQENDSADGSSPRQSWFGHVLSFFDAAGNTIGQIFSSSFEGLAAILGQNVTVRTEPDGTITRCVGNVRLDVARDSNGNPVFGQGGTPVYVCAPG
jgi:hypothetical protein